MTSDKQIQANRLNAQNSLGPQTPQGRKISSMNATLHGGYSARRILMAWEDVDEFDEFYENLFEQLDPVGSIEEFYTEQFIWDAWRQRRISIYEALHSRQIQSVEYQIQESLRLSLLQSRIKRAMDGWLRELKALQIHRSRKEEGEARAAAPRHRKDPRQMLRNLGMDPSQIDARRAAEEAKMASFQQQPYNYDTYMENGPPA